VSLPNSHYAHAALSDSISLWEQRHKGWFMDLDLTLYNVSPHIALPSACNLQPKVVDGLVKSVRKCAAAWLDGELESSVRLYLLHGRLEPVEGKPPRKVVVSFRHYLEVPTPKHRRALTRLLLSDHPLAVEQLRRASRYHPAVPQNDRLCRLCRSHVETPEHVLLLCNASPSIADLRRAFIIALQTRGVHLPDITPASAVRFLQESLYNRSAVNLLAKFVYDALAVVQKTPLYRA
jgi:hypothetical protein